MNSIEEFDEAFEDIGEKLSNYLEKEEKNLDISRLDCEAVSL